MKKTITLECTVYIDIIVDTDKTSHELNELLKQEPWSTGYTANETYEYLLQNGIDVVDSNLTDLTFKDFLLPTDLDVLNCDDRRLWDIND